MSTAYSTHCTIYYRRQIWCKLILCITLSAAFGVVLAASAGELYISLMRTATKRPVSIVGSAVAVFLPSLVSVLLIVHSKPRLLYFVCAIHIASFTATGWALSQAYASAGWMVHLLLQLPQLCIIPMIILLAMQRLSGTFSKGNAVYILIIVAILGMIDICLISPFLANLIDSYETMGRYAFHVGLDRCL